MSCKCCDWSKEGVGINMKVVSEGDGKDKINENSTQPFIFGRRNQGD